ncbi:Dabb family protein [Effusibacillus consociatus]|uniref:Dabb family protein n=1 Tax=Effusibacillus consociatus TaxID=1117041 RepID=A0ABV9PWA9_9BACL
MIEHIVILKFSPETTTEQKDQVIQKLKDLKQQIPGILDLQCNYNFCPRSQGFEIGLTVRFESKQALEEYGPHPKHQEAVSYMREVAKLSDIIVVDFEI